MTTMKPRARIAAASLAALSASVGLMLWSTRIADAHCDTMDGPVVTAARRALREHDVALVLVWVQPDDEATIRQTFEQTLAVRRLGPRPREMADRWFFETLVRVHRAGEGAPFTGLQPAGTETGPAIAAADRALASGSSGEVERLLVDAVRAGLRRRFERARSTAGYASSDVPAGREHVHAYVDLVHWADGVYGAASGESTGEEAEHHPGAAEPHHH